MLRTGIITTYLSLRQLLVNALPEKCSFSLVLRRTIAHNTMATGERSLRNGVEEGVWHRAHCGCPVPSGFYLSEHYFAIRVAGDNRSPSHHGTSRWHRCPGSGGRHRRNHNECLLLGVSDTRSPDLEERSETQSDSPTVTAFVLPSKKPAQA